LKKTTTLQPQITNLSVKQAIIRECQWCGELFVLKSPNQRYCSKKCSKDGKIEKNRLRQRKFYKTYGKDRYKKRLNPCSNSNRLSEHANVDDFDLELKKVQKELKRLNLSDF
jgi:predicted nucleic acid-binding Zn ribbon protein